MNLLIPYEATTRAISKDKKEPKIDPKLYPPFSLKATSVAKKSALLK